MPAACILSIICSAGPSPSKRYGGAGRDSEKDSKGDQRADTASVLEKLGRLGGRCLREAAIEGPDPAWSKERSPCWPSQHMDGAGRLGLKQVLHTLCLSGGFLYHKAGVLESEQNHMRRHH